MSRQGVAVFLGVAVTIAIMVGVAVDWPRGDSPTRAAWQQAVVPGSLSQSHAFLKNQCVACHTPIKGVEPALCISCHADNTALLQRQPTAFHAEVRVCVGCHIEHQGTSRMPTTMVHALLANAGQTPKTELELSAPGIEAATVAVNQLPRPEERGASPSDASSAVKQLSAKTFLSKHPGGSESMLNCVSCHATKDRHQGLLGADCAQCHATSQWTIAGFVHPSVSSTECAQCHKPPPSHNMMHFSMMSAPLARQPNARVNQCYLCHQTTSWNDIRGVGRVKVH